MDHDAQSDPQNPPGDVKENALPRVEADEPAPVVGLKNKKDDRRDDGEIGQHAGYIVGESRGGDRGDDHAPAATRRAGGRAFGNLRATHIAKCHWISPSHALW